MSDGDGILDVDVLIIGAGPTGLGAAWRLHELGKTNWLLVDKAPTPGGLACSVVDEHGFVWDMGGHVLFSHYEYFDKLVDYAKSDDHWLNHVRESWVYMRKKWIPYPLQNNVWQLPVDDLIPCLNGLVEATKSSQLAHPPCKSFEEWIVRSFGQGLADAFMNPYNFKVWAYPTKEMNAVWVGERVATVDLARILKNMVLRKEDAGWGPNATFRFPLRGGTGSIWTGLYNKLPKERSKLGAEVVRIQPEAHIAHFADGRRIRYKSLVSTMPLDLLLKSLEGRPELTEKADSLKYSSSHIIGLGVQGKVPVNLATKCWLYFPESNCPFYRVTVFSNYSPYNVPKPGEQYSLMCEVSESPVKPVNAETVVQECEDSLKQIGMLPDDARVVSRYHIRLERGYPTPYIGRDELLNELDPKLMALNIYSRGRFGGWRYEVANQDHSLMQGVEVIDQILFGTEEMTYRYPNIVNAKKNTSKLPIIPAHKTVFRS